MGKRGCGKGGRGVGCRTKPAAAATAHVERVQYQSGREWPVDSRKGNLFAGIALGIAAQLHHLAAVSPGIRPPQAAADHVRRVVHETGKTAPFRCRRRRSRGVRRRKGEVMDPQTRGPKRGREISYGATPLPSSALSSSRSGTGASTAAPSHSSPATTPAMSAAKRPAPGFGGQSTPGSLTTTSGFP